MSIQQTERVVTNTAPAFSPGETNALKKEIKMLEGREKWLKSQEKIYEKQLEHLGGRWFAYEILPLKTPTSNKGPELLLYKKELKNNIKSREEYIKTLVSEINQKTAEIQKCRHSATYTAIQPDTCCSKTYFSKKPLLQLSKRSFCQKYVLLQSTFCLNILAE